MSTKRSKESLSASQKREIIGEMLAEGLTQAEAARRLGLCKSTISYHARRLGVPACDKYRRRYDWLEIQQAYDSGLTVRECAQQFGFSSRTWQEAAKRGKIKARPTTMPISELLVIGRTQTSRFHLKQRLLKEGLKTHRCEQCGLTEWQDQPISMNLHHINGDGDDNRLSNLEFLCPNCHSQTENFGGRKLQGKNNVVHLNNVS